MWKRILVSLLCGAMWWGCVDDDPSTKSGSEDVAIMGDTTQKNIEGDAASVEEDFVGGEGEGEGEGDATDVISTEKEEEELNLGFGTISGRIVNAEGVGLVGIKMLSCTSSLCVSGETTEDGAYLFEGIDAEPQKMQATDVSGVYMSVVFYQDCVADAHEKLVWDVVMPERVTPEVGWEAGGAGEVVLADGAFVLTLEEGSLEYPLGFFDAYLRAERVPALQLPPYDKQPWAETKGTAFAFYFYPLHIMAKSPPAFRVEGGIDQPEGTVFEIWSVHPDTARVEMVGEAVVDDTGGLVSAPDAEIEHLTALIFAIAD